MLYNWQSIKLNPTTTTQKSIIYSVFLDKLSNWPSAHYNYIVYLLLHFRKISLSLKYQYQYRYQYPCLKYKYKYQYFSSKYQYQYKYLKMVLKYRSSTSTSTQYYNPGLLLVRWSDLRQFTYCITQQSYCWTTRPLYVTPYNISLTHPNVIQQTKTTRPPKNIRTRNWHAKRSQSLSWFR